MKLHVKYMVSLRCKMVVKAALDNMGLPFRSVELGEIDLIANRITPKQRSLLKAVLMKSGL